MTSFTLDVRISEASLAKVTKTLDKYQGKPLALRTQKATQAGMGLFVAPLKARAGRHNMTAAQVREHRGAKYPPVAGATQAGYAVRKLRQRNYTEIAAYKVGSNTWYRHFAIVGTKVDGRQAIRPDPYVDAVKGTLQGQVLGFIDAQITRLA